MRISHSKVECYSSCPHKYFLRYVEKLEVNKTFTALHFGSAMDKAFNYLLLRKKREKAIYADTAKAIFLKEMKKWDGTTELVFFKSEMPPEEYDESDPVGNQDRCFAHLCSIGQKMIDTYIEEIIPTFEKVLAVQTKKIIKNDEGDELILIVDFTAQLKDGRVVTFDNKTTSDVRKNYPQSSVKKSQQLAIYSEFAENRLAGYIALGKKLDKKGRIPWTLIVDEIPEEQAEAAFEKIDNTLRSIKKNEFPKNEKSCFLYQRRCEYYLWCHHQNPKDLKIK